MSTLKNILTQAVRGINKANDIKLEKRAEKGDATQGAGIYRDQQWGEYRVIFVADGEHLSKADYHTPDLDDAMASAARFVDKHAGELADTGVDPDAAENEKPAEEAQVATMDVPVRSRPRGFYSHPSPLLSGLLMRSPYVPK